MAEITTTQAFSDGDTVTATKLNNITANAAIQTEAITNRSAETTVDQANDLLLMYDASATALKKVTPSSLIKAGTSSNFPVTGNVSVGGTLGVTGASTLTGNASVGGTLVVTGASTLSSTLGVSDTISSTKATGTGLAVTSNATIGGTLGVGGASTLTGNTTIGGTLGVIGAITASSTVNGTTIPTSKTIVTTDDSQTLTNKTLTSPVISSISNSGTLTLPTSTDTLVCRETTDTLKNKTLINPVISIISNIGTLTLPTSTDTLVGKQTTDILTNKTLVNPVISSVSNTGTITLPTSTDTLVGRNTTDTLTNKTITNPVINTASISGGTINNASVGATTPSTGSFTTLIASGNTTVGGTLNVTGMLSAIGGISGKNSIDARNYGSSTSSSSNVSVQIKIAYGQTTVGQDTYVDITSLPFTSSSTYVCFAQAQSLYSYDYFTLGQAERISGSSIRLHNQAQSVVVNWLAIGY